VIRGFGPKSLKLGVDMKPIVGIGSNTKFGKVLKILKDGVVVENSQGVRETVSFRRIEKSLMRYAK
jgi:sRNA-binding protein